MNLAIRRGHLVCPDSGLDGVADLFIADGVIAAVGRKPAGFEAAREIDATGRVVCPGFVDIGARLREPGFEHKGTIGSESRAAASGGFTTVVALPDTDPVIDNASVLEDVRIRATRARGARVLSLGALTVGLKGEVLAEMQALKDGGVVGVTNAARSVADTSVMRQAMAYASSCDLMVVSYPEDYFLGHLGAAHDGAVATRLGLPAVPIAAEIIGVSRELTLVADTGCRAHFSRLSSPRAARMVTDAQRGGLPVSCDIDVMHLLFCDEDIGNYDANFHLRPPLRDVAERKRLRTALARGAIDALCAGHDPHDQDAKAMPFDLTHPGAATYDIFLGAILATLPRSTLGLGALVRAASTAPSKLLGIAGGVLRAGAAADVCVFDPTHRWIVEPSELHTAGANCPLVGRPLRGRVTHTVVGGRIVFERQLAEAATPGAEP